MALGRPRNSIVSRARGSRGLLALLLVYSREDPVRGYRGFQRFAAEGSQRRGRVSCLPRFRVFLRRRPCYDFYFL